VCVKVQDFLVSESDEGEVVLEEWMIFPPLLFPVRWPITSNFYWWDGFSAPFKLVPVLGIVPHCSEALIWKKWHVFLSSHLVFPLPFSSCLFSFFALVGEPFSPLF